ncbi:unnamed protein product [Heligmosomoides polygyrus]|uniref:MARVEL domain-containing protein n=1 Tax=Heligmosomoides polygyrus TaxID=6339 RepID=A0A183GS78_HELPZ|nr:unnamed protein product [Heligmosomoides polygyrus]
MPSLRPRTHEIVSCVQFGFASMFMFAGYLSTSFIAESIIHSIYQDNPNTISQFAGYYGAVPFQWSLVLGSSLFALYYIGFFRVTWWYFYLSQVFVGFSYALSSALNGKKCVAVYNNGEGAYLSEHSSWRTLESNTAIEIAIGHQW